jgi:zinc protease
VKERQRASDFAHTLTFWWTSAGLDYYNGYIDNAFKVDGKAIAHYVDTFITKKPYVFAVLENPAMKKGGLDQKHFEALLAGGAK